MGWHQSNMFSSTAQVLDAYLEASPLSSATGSVGWTPRTSSMVKDTEGIKETATCSILTSSTSSTPRTSATDDSPAASPASSHTAYSNCSESPQKAEPGEIRRRRLPAGAELRVKNLALTKSNGATHPQPPANEGVSSTTSSNYDQSPPMTSPVNLPPPLPQTSVERSVQRKPVARKPVVKDSEVENIVLSPPQADISTMAGDNLYPRRQAQFQSTVTNSAPKRKEVPVKVLPPRTTSASESKAPAVGMRPKAGHKQKLSTASLNKELPSNPPVSKSHIINQAFDHGITYNTTSKDDAAPISDFSSSHAHIKPDPWMENRVIPPASNGLPSGPKSKVTGSVSRRPVPQSQAPEIVAMKLVDEDKTLLSRGGPALGSLSSGPRPTAAAKHQASASISSLTSATVSGPLALPDFQTHECPELTAEASLRTHRRNRSQPISIEEAVITIGLEAPMTEPRRPILSQTSVQSENSHISRSTTPQSSRSASTAPTSMSSLPDVPEVRTPLVAPEIKESHFSCYTQHRPLVASSNHQTPILCMTCKTDADKMWGCGWCHLRICTGCKDALVEVRNNLKMMIEEAEAGTLIIGKERIPNPAFYNENRVRSPSGDSSSMRSYRSAGSRPMPSRGQGPVFAPRQPPRLRQQHSMDSLQHRGPPRGQYGRMPPPRDQYGAPRQMMRNQPLNYIGMPPIMNNHPRQQIPRGGPMKQYPPMNIGNGNSFRPRQGPQRPQHYDAQDTPLPPNLDLSLGAGAGPMAAGLIGANLNGIQRPLKPGPMMGASGYPSAPRGTRGMI